MVVIEVSFVVFLLVMTVFSFAYFFSFCWKSQNQKKTTMYNNGVQN